MDPNANRVDSIVEIVRTNAFHEIADPEPLAPRGFEHDSTLLFVDVDRLIEREARTRKDRGGNADRGTIAPFLDLRHP